MTDFEMEKLSSSDSHDEIQKNIKILVVGELATGKSSLLKKYLQNDFSEAYKTTFGVKYSDTEIEWNDRTTLNIQFWDISGYELSNNMTHIYYHQSSAAIVVFDVIREKTLDKAILWKKDIDEKVITSNGNPIPCLLVGNKIDFYKDGKWYKTEEEMKNFISNYNFINFFETSAKTGKNLNECIDFLIHYIMNNNIEPYIFKNNEGVEEDNDRNHSKSCFH